MTVSTTGAYSVTVTNSFECAASDTAIVTRDTIINPTIVPDGPLTFCDGDSVTLDLPAGYTTYDWTTGAMATSIVTTVAGDFHADITDSKGCSGESDTVSVVVNALPTPALIPSGATTFCDGDSVILDAGAGFSAYAWSSGETSSTITVKTGGSYDVTVTDAIGCIGSSAPEVIVVNSNPAPALAPSGSTTFCDGGSVDLDGTLAGAASYAWSSGASTASITVTTAGSYDVTVTDVNGCVGTSAAEVVTVNANPTPAITPASTTTFCDGGSVDLDADAGFSVYAWSSGASTASITVSAAGTYDVTVTDINGCIGASAIETITVNSNPTPAITPASTTTFCDGGSVDLDADAGFSVYAWSSGASDGFYYRYGPPEPMM